MARLLSASSRSSLVRSSSFPCVPQGNSCFQDATPARTVTLRRHSTGLRAHGFDSSLCNDSYSETGQRRLGSNLRFRARASEKDVFSASDDSDSSRLAGEDGGLQIAEVATIGAAEAASEMEELQKKLDVAVANEEYAEAALLRDRLRKLQEDDEGSVLAANLYFYRAFERSDMRMMRKIWSTGSHVQCIHPGANCIAGYDDVMESWEMILDNTGSGGASAGQRTFRIQVEDVRVLCRGSMAVLTCVEVLSSASSSGRVLATNAFEKTSGGQWRMFLHHGAPAPPPVFQL
eukprot:TRINITY_DN1151_c0_g1_i4.p1 TRINITY_DN1151_c0_g1~~TRINITY_DN1151_c0_g1_i4.p1  ORF type:complete len:290 (-),score=64.31 TRINITY_DN1151_c0_g1_i4:138-1007(-)